MKTAQKICIYTRVSKTDGSQDVARQVADLREFAKHLGISIALVQRVVDKHHEGLIC